MTNYIHYICIVIMLIEPHYLRYHIIVHLVVRSNKLKLNWKDIIYDFDVYTYLYTDA